MRKRLRKKKHLGEFKEYGVNLEIKLKSYSDLNQFLDEFILDAVERNGLQFGGSGSSAVIHGVLEVGDDKSKTQNLSRISIWLSNHDAVNAFDIGECFDLWQ